jgi:hypothetical protein
MKTTNQENLKDKIKNTGIEFYVTVISIVTIVALVISDISEKKLESDFVKSGLVQKVEGSKIIWVKP